MRNLLRHLRAAFLYARFFPYIEEADGESFWTPADEQALANFFNSYTGNKLKARLTNYAIKVACAAVKHPGSSPYENGVAAGVPMTIAAIESHFPQAQPTGEEQMAEEQIEALTG